MPGAHQQMPVNWTRVYMLMSAVSVKFQWSIALGRTATLRYRPRRFKTKCSTRQGTSPRLRNSRAEDRLTSDHHLNLFRLTFLRLPSPDNSV